MIIIHKPCPTHQSKPRVRARYRQLRERTSRLQALLDPDHWRNVRLQKGT